MGTGYGCHHVIHHQLNSDEWEMKINSTKMCALKLCTLILKACSKGS